VLHKHYKWKHPNCKDCFLSNSEEDIWAALTRPSTLMGEVGHESISKSLVTQQLSAIFLTSTLCSPEAIC